MPSLYGYGSYLFSYGFGLDYLIFYYIYLRSLFGENIEYIDSKNVSVVGFISSVQHETTK